MAKRDWKKAMQETLEVLGDRLRDALDALLGPQPELVPVPVPSSDDAGRRRR